MESFFRYISYVDYYKKEEKVRNVGFLRWKLYNGRHKIEFQIKDVSCPQGNYQIEEKRTGKVIGEIVIEKGIGNFTKEFLSMSASGEMYIDTFDDRLYLSDIDGFMIRLNSNEYLFVPVSLEQEKKAVERLDSLMLEDRVYRAVGVLQNARILRTDEFMECLSQLRLGVSLGMVEGPKFEEMNALLCELQPANLVQADGAAEDPAVRDRLRAERVRNQL